MKTEKDDKEDVKFFCATSVSTMAKLRPSAEHFSFEAVCQYIECRDGVLNFS